MKLNILVFLFRYVVFISICLPFLALMRVNGSDADEMKVKRKEVFEFTEKPKVTRRGDIVTITFTSKDYCDVAVAIEDDRGNIIRHLVSGVLGSNAPEGLQKDSLKQTIVWDGKTDQGILTDNKDELNVRVSLGLMPKFEKNIYSSPYKRISEAAPLIQACEEGVVVCEGSGVDSVKMYDHKGDYLRTIYPFPANKLEQNKTLDWRDFPQGMHLPWKLSIYQQTLLNSGDNCYINNQQGRHGRAATGFAVSGNRMALGFWFLNRINTDGTVPNLKGGKTSFPISLYTKKTPVEIGPSSMAISPDQKWVYMAGYTYRFHANFDTMNGVARIPLDGPGDAEVFLGEMGSKNGETFGGGTEPGKFRNAISVDCDSQGRVYVADYMNDRIQVFSPEAKFLKEIKTLKPAVVRVNRKTGEIYVFSWLVASRELIKSAAAKQDLKFRATYARFVSFDDPKEVARIELPEGHFTGGVSTYISLPHPLYFTGDIDVWAEKPTIWIGRDCRNDIERGITTGNGGQAVSWDKTGIKLYHEKDGKLELIKDFGAETVKEAVRAKPPTNAVQHLYVNPKTGKLYIAEADSAPTTKASMMWVEVEPSTGKINLIDLPFNPIDCAFDLDGYAYLRNTDKIMRFDPTTWKEVPFDYGAEVKAVGRDGGIGGRSTPAISALVLPAKSPVCYHQGGIHISPKGHIIAACAYRFEGISGSGAEGENRQFDPKTIADQGKGYEPPIFPGRLSSSTSPCIHVWNKHGSLIYEDAVPGVAQVDGVAMDANDHIYFMHTPSRNIDGKPNMNEMSETLTKVKPKKAKFLSTGKRTPVPLPKAEFPEFGQQMKGMWAIGAEWFYPGVGFAGFSASQAGDACACWFSRFALDLYARSFAPEPQQFNVAVVDSAGNLIMRIGRYGNVDSAGEKSKVPLGGDEVGLFHPLYTGVHTDHRLYISDYGNGRVLSVALDYHANEKIALKDVPDSK